MRASGQRGRDGLGIGLYVVGAVAADQHEGGHGDRRRLLGIEPCRFLGPGLPGDGVGGGDACLPGGQAAIDGELLLGHPDDLSEEGLQDSLPVPLGEQCVQPLLDAGRQCQLVGVRGRPPLIQHEPADIRSQRCTAERAQPAEGVAEHVDRGPGGLGDRVDHGGDVLELPRHAIVGRVTAGAAAAAVQRVDGRVRLQVRQQGTPAGVVGGRSVDEHQRWPLAAGPVGDGGAVAGQHPRHG
jgi:hypothetical protein